MATRSKSTLVVRYAVVGQGYIAQAAVLPAFRHARGNSRLEGLADVRVIRALYRSARTGRRVKLEPRREAREPTMRQEKTRPPGRKRPLVNATPPSG